MAQRKIQLLRSQTIYADIDAARNSIDNSFAETAGLSDGELVLARYYATEIPIGGGSKTVVRSLLGIYNSKDSNYPGFTYITNEREIDSIITNIYNRLDTIEQSIDALDLNSSIGGSTGTAVTEIDQQNGQVSGTATAVEDLTLDGYTKTNDTGDIDAGDSLEVAFSKLENAIDTIDIDIHSSDETITVTPDATGKNLEVNIDGLTIVQDPTAKTLKTNLQISKITTGLEANVKEAYRLQDSGGNIYGQQINVYKDSTLKEVYIGSEYDTVDAQTGEVRKIVYEAYQDLLFIDDTDYRKLSATEQSLYTATTRNVYNISASTISDEAYQQLDPSVKELYIAFDAVTWKVNPAYETIYDDTYSELTAAQQAAYTATTQSVYQLNNEYLTDGEFNDIYGGGALNTIYHRLGASSIGASDIDYQSLNFVYYLADGTYELVKVDISKFLTEQEFGDGLMSLDNTISVNAGDGLDFGGGYLVRRPLVVKIDTSSGLMTLSSDGVGINTTALDQRIQDIANANQEIDTVSDTSSVDLAIDANKDLTANVKLDITTQSVAADHTYAANNGNVLQIKTDGLYLDSTWDCGEY